MSTHTHTHTLTHTHTHTHLHTHTWQDEILTLAEQAGVYGPNVIVEEEQGGEGEGGALLLQSVDMGYHVTFGLAAKQVCV